MSGGSSLYHVVSLAREKPGMGVWFKHPRQLCGKRIPLADRFQLLYSTAGAAFWFGAGGVDSTESWRRCTVLKVKWLRAIILDRGARSGLGMRGDRRPPASPGPVGATDCLAVHGWMGHPTLRAPPLATRPRIPTGGGRP